MIIYRIENENRIGPYEAYKGYYSPPWWNEHDPHPGPSRDGLHKVTHADRFAFYDLLQLFDWFSRRAIDFAEDHGFRVVAIYTDGRRIRKGGRQVTYREEHVTHRSIIDKRDLERALTAYEAMWMGELGFPTKQKGA